MTFYYVYVLRSLNFDFIYIGFTDNLKRRFKEHNSKLVLSTKHYVPLDLIHWRRIILEDDPPYGFIHEPCLFLTLLICYNIFMQIPDKVKRLFDKTALVSFGTGNKNGQPNVNCVFWKKILEDNETIILIDNFMNRTVKNIIENNQVCLSFWDAGTEEAYKIYGLAKYHIQGKVYEEGKKHIQLKNPNRIPKGVIEINVKEIYLLTPGSDAGRQL